MKSATRSVAGPPTPKVHQDRQDLEGNALACDKMLASDAQHRDLGSAFVHGLKRDYSILQELEAGEREANERNSLNARLFELGTELRKEMYPGAGEIRALSRRCGPDLAKSVGLLIEENKALRLKLQSSIRSHARLEGTAAGLGNALRDHEERTYARDLAAAKTTQEGAFVSESKVRRVEDTLDRLSADASARRAEDAPGGGFVNRYCRCSEKLQELLNCIDSQIGDYERGVWQAQVNVLEEERDSLMLKTVVMRQRLAEVQAKIISDPFLAARFGTVGEAEGPFGAARGRNTMAEMRDTLVQLATAQVARASGLRCDMLRGTVAQAAEASAVKELQGFTRSEKESLRLLRLARDRIAADAQSKKWLPFVYNSLRRPTTVKETSKPAFCEGVRKTGIENYVARVRELEQEVADLRCDMTQLERGHGEDVGDSDEVSDNDEKWCVALRAGNAAPSDVEYTVAALRTSRDLLVDRAEATKALNMLEDRKRELRERQEKPLGDATVLPPLGGAGEELPSKDEQKLNQRIDIPNQSDLATPTTGLHDALTTDKAREIFRRLMVLREYAQVVRASVACQKTASKTAVGRSNEPDGQLNVTELKKLQNDIDRREISLQQAEEAVQARAALRTIEAEHAKTLQRKEAEFEERTRLQAKQAHEQLVKQQKAYEAQLAKERDRCESLRAELELQAKELDLQRHLAEENIRATSQKQQQELEDELRRLREQQRQTEMELQRTLAEAAQEASAMQSAATQEKLSLSAAVQAAERKASEALKVIQQKEREMETLQEKLKQSQAERRPPPIYVTPSPAAEEKDSHGGSEALMPPLTAKKIIPARGEGDGLQGTAEESPATQPALSPKSHFNQMVLGKYTSLASAFRHMDVDHSGTVKLSEFANFVDDLGMNIPFSVTHDLYKELAAPCDGMLMLSSFYRNLKGDSCTLTELHRRLEEIFGDVEQPFNDAGIPSDGRVSKEQFILIADEAGVSSVSANDLWNSMDRSHRGSLQRENVLLLLEDNVELDEVERVEQEAAAVLSNVLNVFSGSLKAPKPEAKVSRRSSFKKLTYSAAHRQLGFTPAEAQADDVLANSPPWDCIYPEDRKAMVSDMKARTVGRGQLIQAEEDPDCPLFIVIQGTVDIFQPVRLVAFCKWHADVLLDQGDDADHVLMVKDGEAVAVGLKSSDEEVEVRVYRPLDFFGDGTIVKNRLHTASVRARTKCTILSIESAVFYNILQKLETEFRRRSGRSSTVEGGYLESQNISTEGASEDESGLPDSSVTTEEKSEDGGLSKTSEASQPRELNTPVAATPREETLVDSELIERLLQEEATRGEAPDKFYIVESGTVSIEIYVGCEHAKRMYSQKTTQHATADDTTSRLTEAEIPEVLHLLSGVPVIKLLTLDQLKELVRAFQVINVGEREVVMHEGDPADKFYILLEGMVSIQKSPEPGKPRKEVAVVHSGEYLGEIAFLNNQPRTASCVAKTKLLYLGRDEFNKYLGHLSEAFLQHAESMYSTHQAEMPSWLLDASSKGGSGSGASPDNEVLEEEAATLAEGKKSSHKEKKAKTKSSGEASDATTCELEGGDPKKKKKKSKEKDKDKAASKVGATTAPIARGDLDRLRDLLAGTFKNKYGSLAHAFAAMDVNNSDIVDADEFYAFIKKSNVRGFQKPELDAIFDELCRPIKGRLIVGNLYRNARGVEPTGAEIHLRAVEIYGSALAAFKKVANLDAGDLCSKENFTSLAAAVGVDKDKAERIWSQYVEGIKSTDDRVVLSTLIGLMSALRQMA
ncbi:hypothetical protein ACSSS7_004540 [Eimeria intestinalis]